MPATCMQEPQGIHDSNSHAVTLGARASHGTGSGGLGGCSNCHSLISSLLMLRYISVHLLISSPLAREPA